ncbi:hypothetical protein OG713_34585 [Streptomyces sp. NBC_00723]|uniref:hypothetical protein n=1 Tax=Streptomyces sp. NBC_00723 TaxID=2903673 RepID=UPI00386C58A0
MSTPPPRLSPIAGAFNALVRHLNRRYRARIHELEAAIVAEQARSRTAEPLAWIDDRIRHRPDQRHAWRQLKRLMTEDLEAAASTQVRESTVNRGRAS